MGKYLNTKNFTGLNVDNYLERASKAVIYQEGSNLVNGAIVFGRTVGSEYNNVSSNSGLLTTGYVQLYNKAGGVITPIINAYDATSDIVLIAGGSGTTVSIPASFTTWMTNHHNNVLGSFMTIGCQIPGSTTVYSCDCVVIGCNNNTLQLTFSLFGTPYHATLNYSSNNFIQWSCYEAALAVNVLPLSAGPTKALQGDLYLSNRQIYLDLDVTSGHLGDVNGYTTLVGGNSNPICLQVSSYVYRLPSTSEETSGTTVGNAHILASREWTNNAISNSISNMSESIGNAYITLANVQQILNAIGHILGFTCSNVEKNGDGQCVVTLDDQGDAIVRVVTPSED